MKRSGFVVVATLLVLAATPYLFAQPSELSATYLPLVFQGPTNTPTPSATPTAQPTPTIGPTPTVTPLPPSFVDCATPPATAAPNYPIEIRAIDKVAETVTLKNITTDQIIDLTGWTMCSITGGQKHPISGLIGWGETKSYVNTGAPIWNNSASDPGALYDPQGRLVAYWPD